MFIGVGNRNGTTNWGGLVPLVRDVTEDSKSLSIGCIGFRCNMVS